MSFKNLLTLSEEDIEGLHDAGNRNSYFDVTEQGMDKLGYEEETSMSADDLLRDIIEVGHDGVEFVSDGNDIPDGGEQVLIPRGSSLTPKLKKITYNFADGKAARKFAKKMKLKVDGEYDVDVPLKQLKDAEKVMRQTF